MSADGLAVPAEGDLLLLESEDIQGNILAPFNKPYQRFLFISFGNDRVDARRWLARLVDEVASTKQVVDHGVLHKEGKATHEWVGVSFTSSGLVVLDSDLAKDLVAFDAFWQGPIIDLADGEERMMSPAIVGNVNLGQPSGWVVGGSSQPPVDALLTIAADDPKKLKIIAKRESDRVADLEVKILSWQDCHRLDPNGIGIEPFGFRDGISQPGIRGFTKVKVNKKRLDAEKQLGSPIIATGEFVLGYAGEGGSYPDVRRSTIPDWMHDGSFQVFLRLRQDVAGWTEMLGRLANEFDLPDVAAKAIGRKPGGRALAGPEEDQDLNNFTFEDDLLGEQTPRFAHIRKMNPRNGTFEERTHRLLRRGIPFSTVLNVEQPLSDEGELAAKDIEYGLAFNAFMASIENQFEFLQRSWASNPESLPPREPDGPDPLVGTSEEPGVLRRDGRTQILHFGRLVSTSGAVYGFAPSLRTLRRLSAETDA